MEALSHPPAPRRPGICTDSRDQTVRNDLGRAQPEPLDAVCRAQRW